MPAGYTIRVTTRRVDEESVQELYQVAIQDETTAKEAVRHAAGVPSDALVEIADELGKTDIERLELQPGQVMTAR